MINFGNTACNGSALTTDKRVKFNGYAIDSNCTYDDTGDIYVGICKTSEMPAEICGISYTFQQLSSNIGNRYVATGFADQSSFVMHATDTTHTSNPVLYFCSKNTQWVTDIEFELGVWYDVYIDFSNINDLKVYLNGVLQSSTNWVSSAAPSQYDVFVIKGHTLTGQQTTGGAFIGTLFNLKLYSSALSTEEAATEYTGSKLAHWWPMQEGAGFIHYDVIGGLNGCISAASLNTYWSKKQNLKAYNLCHGFATVPGSENFYGQLQNDKIQIIRSNFECNILGAFPHRTGSLTLSQNFTDNCITATFAYGTLTSYYTYSMFTMTRYPVSNILIMDKNKLYSAKFKWRIREYMFDDVDDMPTRIELFMGSWGRVNDFSYEVTLDNTYQKNVWYELEMSPRANNGVMASPSTGVNTNIWGSVKQNLTTNVVGHTLSFVLDIKDVEVYACPADTDAANAVSEFPALLDGMNNAESKLDFSGDTENVAEIANIPTIQDLTAYTPSDTADDAVFYAGDADRASQFLLYSQPQSDLNKKRISNSLERNL